MKIASVMVTYFPPDNFPVNLLSVAGQVDKVYVIDNGSPSFPLDGVKNLENVTFLFNRENAGLAAAQNVGINLALSERFDWILFLDQDSFLTPNYVSKMLSYFKSLSPSEKNRIFVLAPRIFDEGGGFFYKHLVKWGSFGFKRIGCTNNSIKNVIFVISSGSMIPTWAFKKLGFFKEDFFIDYVDNEFCLRGVSRGFQIHVVCDAVLFHRIGNRRPVKMGSVTIKPTFHPSLRRYSIYRNRTWVWKLYFRRVFPFVLFDMGAALYDLFRILVFEDNSLEKLRYALKGLWAGMTTPVSNSL